MWRYYISGILYGEFKAEGGHAAFRWLDCETAHFSEWQALDEEKNKELQKWSKLDVLEAIREGKDAVVVPAREVCAILVREGGEGGTVLARWREYCGETRPYPVRFAGTFCVAMRDGVQLATDVYLPQGAGEKRPTVLVRTCYGKKLNCHMYYRYVQRGYALVIQDVRGREESGGEFIPMYNEMEDGSDTLDWIAAQDWSSGRVGTVGGSYLGYVQWAMAASGNPHLAAMISVVTAGGAFGDMPRRGGLFCSGMLAWAFMMSAREFRPELAAQGNWDELLDVRPIGDIPLKGLGRRIPWLDEWLKHPHEDAFWQKGDWPRYKDMPPVPALIMSGWFDDNGMGTTQALELTEGWPKRKVILGPWNHGANTRYELNGIHMGGAALRDDLDLLFLKWFDHSLRGIENGVDKEPSVEYYTLGENRWKAAASWPPASGKTLPLYLGESGALLKAPEKDGADSYRYDPQNPARHIADMSENEMALPEDYTEEEKRPDILCYTTPPLGEGITVTGDMRVELFISSSAADADFIVRLTEVDGQGCSVKYADGLLSAKYREGYKAPEPLEEGRVYKLEIRTTKLSKRFEAGRRIRLTITSAAKNFAFPNESPAHNTVHYGAKYPSRIVIPVEG